MNKAEGKKLGIKFDARLVGDITGWTPFPPSWKMISPSGATTSSGFSNLNNAFDGNTSTYCYTYNATPQWIKIQFDKPTWLNGFRWYVNSYMPNEFILEGSNDDENWSILTSESSPSSTGWHEFDFGAGVYTYLRWTITSRYSTRIYLYDVELSVGVGNEGAFTVTGNEYKFVDGPNNNGEVIQINYTVESVEKHPEIEDSILLTIRTPYEFNNVLGNLFVNYDNSKGKLMGRGGLIESFEREFTPADLIPVPDVGITDRLSATTGVSTIDFKPVVYTSVNDGKQDKISARVGEAVIDFKDAGIINP